MKKINLFLLIFTSIVLSFVLVVMFGGRLSARLAAVGFVTKYNLLSQQAPIVINNKEEVRVSDSEDVLSAANKVKSKISSVLIFSGRNFQLLGSAINLSSDGAFVTTSKILGSTNSTNIYVQSLGGTPVKVDKIVRDSATNLAILQTKSSPQPASFSSSSVVNPGQRLILVGGQPQDKAFYFLASFVSSAQTVSGVAFSDVPSRTFGMQPVSGLIPGQAVVSLSGDVLGIWDGGNIIPSDVLQSVSLNYFSNKTNAIFRPAFGFYYSQILPSEAQLRNISEGVEIVKGPSEVGVIPGSLAENAGLRLGDIISTVNGEKITEGQVLEVILEKANPGSNVSFTVKRGQDTININLKVN